MDEIRDGLVEILFEQQPMTVRQVFYQAVTRGMIDKTEREYKGTVVRLLGEMRIGGRVPFGWIADSTRWMRKPNTWSSLEACLKSTAKHYRRSVWDDQDDYIEIWMEKDALAGVMVDVTAEWDVPLMVTRGYASLSFLMSSAETIRETISPTTIYYFGDYDPSGLDIGRNVEKRLREFSERDDLTFERVAVTPEQIDEFNLPTRPTKKTDTRSKNFKGESVELDAIPPDDLRALVRDCIEQHIDHDTHKGLMLVEAEERKILEMFPPTGLAS